MNKDDKNEIPVGPLVATTIRRGGFCIIGIWRLDGYFLRYNHGWATTTIAAADMTAREGHSDF